MCVHDRTCYRDTLTVVLDIADLSSIEECLAGLAKLEVLNLQGNPLCESEKGVELGTRVKQLLPKLTELNGESTCTH